MEHDRRPDVAVHADGQSLVGPDHAGVTVAEMALADEVHRLTEGGTRMSRETLYGPVVISTAERVHAMSEALASAAETFDGYRLGPAADAELRSALAAAPPSTTSRQRG